MQDAQKFGVPPAVWSRLKFWEKELIKIIAEVPPSMKSPINKARIMICLKEHEKTEKTGMQYTPLLKSLEGKMSRPTLSKHLATLQEKGLIKRAIDAKSDKYPPPVFYKLSKEGLLYIQEMRIFKRVFNSITLEGSRGGENGKN